MPYRVHHQLLRNRRVYQSGAEFKDPGAHLFRKYFEDLQVGETVITHKRTVTDSDIVNFANVSWDHFYAHTDATSLDGTIFTQRVAHGYFVLSAAAGLFVDPGKGPVLLNYGLEECRFTKPVYAGMTIGVRLTVKEKVSQEKKNEEDIAKGIVKFMVDVYDETGETVAIATILTMVKKRIRNKLCHSTQQKADTSICRQITVSAPSPSFTLHTIVCPATSCRLLPIPSLRLAMMIVSR
ncbi:hypothetical protein MASR1M65_17980 [Saprospiraceae bacterium]